MMTIGKEDILNPTVWLGEFEWREPVTTLTDFLVALVCWFAVYRFVSLPKSSRNPVSYMWFRNYFITFAIGMTSAAWFGHGLQAYITPRYKVIGWMYGATGLMMLQFGSFQLIRQNLPKFLTRILPIIFISEWAVVIFLMANPTTSNFMVTQINSVVALIILVLPMHLFLWKSVKNVVGRNVVLTLIYSAVPGIIYSNQVSLHHWFNYHDISHVLMAVFMSLMFVSLYRLSDVRHRQD